MRNRESFLIVVIIVIGNLCLSAVAHGADDSVLLQHNGVDGRWFPRPMVDRINEDLLELDFLKAETIPQLQIKLDLRMKRIEDLRLAINATSQALKITKEALKMAEDTLTEAENRALEAEREIDAWYHNPVIMLGIGVLAATAIGIAVYSIN